MTLYAEHVNGVALSARYEGNTHSAWSCFWGVLERDPRFTTLSLLQKAVVELCDEMLRVRSFYEQTLQAAFGEVPVLGAGEPAPRVRGKDTDLYAVDRS